MAKESEGVDLEEERIEADMDRKSELQERQGRTQPAKEAQSSAVMEGSCFSEMFFG
jgi:hypothetical protein